MPAHPLVETAPYGHAQASGPSAARGRRLLKIRRSSYHDAVQAEHLAQVLDTSGIQLYVTNQNKVAFIRPRPTPRTATAPGGQPRAPGHWQAAGPRPGLAPHGQGCRPGLLAPAAEPCPATLECWLSPHARSALTYVFPCLQACPPACSAAAS
jgi:hypothetical protein